jgi:hypothetical protein
MSEEPENEKELLSERVYLQRIARDMRTMVNLMTRHIFILERAESEIPERVRRYTNYMHDIHDITYMYEERGLPVPQHQLREMERCDDRFRQILKEEFQGGTLDKVRREMSDDPENRWDHTKQLTFHGIKKKENINGQSPVAEEQKRPSGEKG